MAKPVSEMISNGLCAAGVSTACGALYGLAVTPIGPGVGALMGTAASATGLLCFFGTVETATCFEDDLKSSQVCAIAATVAMIALPLIAGLATATGTLLAAGAVPTFSAALGYGSLYYLIAAALGCILHSCMG